MKAFALVALICAGQAQAAPPGMGDTRRAAETLAEYAALTGDTAMLTGAVQVMAATGARLAPDDPWIGRFLDLLPYKLTRRGIVSGASGGRVRIPSGASVSIEAIFAADEQADAEARLLRGSGSADLELRILDSAGTVIAADIGAETGTLGRPTFTQWIPDRCAHLIIQITNVGPEEAHAEFLASTSRTPGCEAEGSRQFLADDGTVPVPGPDALGATGVSATD